VSGALRAKGRHARPATNVPTTGEPPAAEAGTTPGAGTTPEARSVLAVGTAPEVGSTPEGGTSPEAGRTPRADRTPEAGTSPGGGTGRRAAARRARTAAAVREAQSATGHPRATVVRRVAANLGGAATTLRSSSRRTKTALAGAVCLTTALTASAAAFLTLFPVRSGPKVAAVNVLAARPAPAPAALVPPRSSRAARRGDQTALTFYEQRDPAHAAHVTEVIWTGPMLRVYTDLPASDADSRTAIALCETAEAYAQDHGRLPAVFVHADRQAGYPVLANKMGTHDDCKLGRVP
jgi:hypothetical protein